MSDALKMLIAIELVGLAALPLAAWLFGSLPDRGYAFAKTLGLLVIAYAVWLIGNVIPIGADALSPILGMTALAAAAWWFLGRRAIGALRPHLRVIAVEEAIFLAAFIGWSLLRAFVLHPDINHTEQYMDLAFLNSSMHSISYPPYDPWMSGHTINYYYFGYLLFGLLLKGAGIAPAIGYNLILSLIAALTLMSAFGVAYALVRRIPWALLGPLFVGMIGNSYGLFSQILHGAYPDPAHTWWFFSSTRVIGSATDYTITEFPLFSIILGDMHPHVMSLPFTILAIAVAASALWDREQWTVRTAAGRFRLTAAALVVGSLFSINSWDYPTYALVVVAALGAQAYMLDSSTTWWREPLAASAAFGVGSLIVIAPFYVHFRSLAHGVGFVHTHSALGPYLETVGFPLLLATLLVGSLALLLRPVPEESFASTGRAETGGMSVSERGATDMISVVLLALIALLLVVSFALNLAALLIPLAICAGALLMLQRVLNTEEPNRADTAALILVAVGCLVLASTEVLYIRDAFDGSTMYRMNTVFKFYYQAWLLLMLAGAYGVYRGWTVIGQVYSRSWGALILAVAAIGTAIGLTYTLFAPSQAVAGSVNSLDGEAWLWTSHSGDASAITWLASHAPRQSVVLEAEKDDYNATYARVSTFSALPTVMGWPGHESQWRPDDPEVGRRTQDVATIYSTANVAQAQQLLHRYHVHYVFVGDTEHTLYGANPTSLQKFGRFMRVAYQSGPTIVYTWSGVS